ncbi:MAG: ABC transporter ATP-binding protein [Gemmatimonadetes bacterium]|nr:ABC transporter ATP-binding protein [Gemmatimonadota bacterium]MCH8810273.1 ABC transporter ATP-binding protein [Gemmatimonadota bacterium]
MTAPDKETVATPLGVLRHYWRVVDGKVWHLALPISLILLAGAFEFASFSLLLPLTDGVVANSFDSLESSRWFGWITSLVPASLDGSGRDAYLVICIVALMVLGRIGKQGTQYVARRVTMARNERYRVNVSRETFGRVLTFGRQYFDRQAIGRIDAEIGWSSSVLGLLIAAQELFRFVVQLLVKVAVMMAISIPLSIAFLVTLPLVQVLVASINRAVKRISEEGVEVDRQIRTQILDILGAIPLVKAYSQERTATEMYEHVLRKGERVAVRRDRAIAIRYPIEEITILFAMLLVQGVFIYVSGDFRPVDLMIFAAFLLPLQQSLRDYKMISQFSVRVYEELPRLEAVAELFSDDGKFIVPSGERTFQGIEHEIEVSGLGFRYEQATEVLHDLNATIPAGKVTAVVGSSGAGKTTFVDLIARFYDCEPGTIFLDGTDIREYSLPSLHSRMAIVSQDVWLLNRSFRDNLTFGLERTVPDEELFSVLADVEMHDLVTDLPDGLDTEVGDRGVRLSGGQRQRIALARALLRDPDIVILDEATSALDSVIEQSVAAAIKRRLTGHTLIVIAHRLSTIRDADLILVFEGGRIVERGTWHDLIERRGAFHALYQAQSEKDTTATADLK